jgi:hypothetical protein
MYIPRPFVPALMPCFGSVRCLDQRADFHWIEVMRVLDATARPRNTYVKELYDGAQKLLQQMQNVERNTHSKTPQARKGTRR